MHDSRRFATLLRDIQEHAGLSQESIGNLAGANRSTVNRWMRGKQQPQYLHVSRLTGRLRREHPELGDLPGDLLAAAGYGAPGPDDESRFPGLPPDLSREERQIVLAYIEVRRAAERRGA
jgi:transcriptional regulator with XRE-family HTH domain